MPGYVTLGTDMETGQPVWIGDTQRWGGVYLLGRARTGKSNTLISVALQDIERGIGLVFIDPHADAIQAILDRLPGHRLKDVMLLDPTDNDYSFSINPLYCANPHNLQERQLTFGQTWEVFAKVFEEDERLGILLRKYLGNCLYPLIEHQGYTLYDIWYFLQDETFRESILNKVTYHPEVVEFWHDAYNNMLPRQKQEEPQSLLNRIDSLRRNPYIKHVISQTGSGIDFVDILAKQKIVLLRLPPWQDSESRAFIGTLVISQLLKAIFLRAEVAEHLRTPFALYCDEFQLFATPDFAKVLTQTGKYLLMPTVGHQDRFGQFKPNDPNSGATLAAPVKMLFRTSVPDSQEIAPELAKDSPTETKRERLLVISQNPVEDILRGHANPTIQGFVREYLRSLSHRLEDTEAAKEGVRIRRQQSLDAARLMQSRAQLFKEDLRNPVSWRFGAVLSAQNLVIKLQQGAQQQNSELYKLFQSTQALRQVMRNLDSFLTAIMEGRIAKGQEAYARFLREHLAAFFPISSPLTLYIALEYGDSSMSRKIPFELARRHGLYRSEVEPLLIQAEERTNRERRAFAERYVKEEWRRYCSYDRRWDPIKLEQELRTPKKLTVDVYFGERVEESRLWCPPDLYTQFVWMECFPEVKRLVAPYYTAQFDPLCKARALDTDINRLIRRIEQCLAVGPNPYMSKEAKAWRGDNGAVKAQWSYYRPIHAYNALLHPKVVAKLMVFLREYKEGAFVTLALLHAASLGEWRPVVIPNSLYIPKTAHGKTSYHNTSMLNVPCITGKDPLEILHLIARLNTLMCDLQQDYDTFSNKFYDYFERRYAPDNILERILPPKKSKQKMGKDFSTTLSVVTQKGILL